MSLSDNPKILAILHKQYKLVKRQALRSGQRPPSFNQYCTWAENQVALRLSHDMAADIPSENQKRTHYMAMRLKDLPDGAHVASVAIPCVQCGDDCAVDITMLEYAVNCAGVICNPCIAEKTGKSANTVIVEQVKKFLNHD